MSRQSFLPCAVLFLCKTALTVTEEGPFYIIVVHIQVYSADPYDWGGSTVAHISWGQNDMIKELLKYNINTRTAYLTTASRLGRLGRRPFNGILTCSLSEFTRHQVCHVQHAL